MEQELYSGWLRFRNEQFAFSFNGKVLHLIPPEDKKEKYKWDWFHESIVSGLFVPKSDKIDERFIEGECYETNSKIVFIVLPNSYLCQNNSALVVPLWGYILFEFGKASPIDRICLKCPELNYIYSLSRAIQHKQNKRYRSYSIKTIPINKTKSEEQVFEAFGEKCKVYFSGVYTPSSKPNEAPLQVNTSLMVEFKRTSNYDFIIKLWDTCYRFIQYLSYRRNIHISSLSLERPYKGGKHEKCAEMHWIHLMPAIEEKPMRKDMFIHQEDIAGIEGKLLSDIAETKLYTRHIPDSYESGRHINEARFVMITAAFEWEFSRLYPNGVKKSEKIINAENQCKQHLEVLISENTGKVRDIYKHFLKQLENEGSLPEKVIQIGKDFSEMTEDFGKGLYKLNDSQLNYSKMAERLSAQRNHFAHGDLDKEFIGDSLLDLIYLEWVIYAIQLKYYGIPYEKRRTAINDLFGLNKYFE